MYFSQQITTFTKKNNIYQNFSGSCDWYDSDEKNNLYLSKYILSILRKLEFKIYYLIITKG